MTIGYLRNSDRNRSAGLRLEFASKKHLKQIKLITDTMQICSSLRNLSTFLGVHPSEFLSHSITPPCTIIINPQLVISRFATTTTDPDSQIKTPVLL